MIPEISIVIPHRNRFELLRQTIASVKRQTYSSWELLIIDDYSEIEVAEYIRHYIEADRRILFYCKTTEVPGASSARNIGLRLAKGKFILFLDSDDLLAPFALEHRIQVFHISTRPIQVVFSPTIRFKKYPGDDNRTWGFYFSPEKLLSRFFGVGVPWHTMGGLWKVDFVRLIGGWNEVLSCYQDWEFHIRAIVNGVEYVELQEYDNFYREVSDSQSIAYRFFHPNMIEGRFKAFKMVSTLLRNGNRRDVLDDFRGIVIRNLILLIENKKCSLVLDLLRDGSRYSLTIIDISLLRMLCRWSTTWRYRKWLCTLISWFWSGIHYDPWREPSGHQYISGKEASLQYDYSD